MAQNNKFKRILLPGVLSASLLLTACGSDEDEGTAEAVDPNAEETSQDNLVDDLESETVADGEESVDMDALESEPEGAEESPESEPEETEESPEAEAERVEAEALEAERQAELDAALNGSDSEDEAVEGDELGSEAIAEENGLGLDEDGLSGDKAEVLEIPNASTLVIDRGDGEETVRMMHVSVGEAWVDDPVKGYEAFEYVRDNTLLLEGGTNETFRVETVGTGSDGVEVVHATISNGTVQLNLGEELLGKGLAEFIPEEGLEHPKTDAMKAAHDKAVEEKIGRYAE